MSKSRGVLVLYAGVDELRLVRARVDRFTVELSDPCILRCSGTGEDAHSLTDDSALDALAGIVSQKRWFGHDLYCLIGGGSIACQCHDMPPLKGAALRQAVQLKLGQQLHFNVSDAIVAIDTISPAKKGDATQIRVAVTACHRDMANAAVTAAERVGLNLIGLSAAPAALTVLAADSIEREDGLHAFLYFDERGSTLVVLDGTEPCVTTELPVGGADISAALMRPVIAGDDVIELDEPKAIALRDEIGIPAPDQKIESLNVVGDRVLPLLEPVLQKLASQLTQWLTFASTNANRKRVSSLRLVGPGADIPGLAETVGMRINIETRSFDWLAGTRLAGGCDDVSLQPFGACVGAARHWRALPDLLPPPVRRQRRVNRVRRALAVGGPVAALVLFGVGTMFDRLDAEMRPLGLEREAQLVQVRELLGQCTKWDTARRQADTIEGRLQAFSDATPLWIGFFKELSALLPKEFYAERFDARTIDGRVYVTIVGDVYADPEALGFDEIKEKMLAALVASPFCHEVREPKATRHVGGKSGLSGTISVEIALAYVGAGTESS